MENNQIKDELHNRLDSIVVSLNQNLRTFLQSVKIPEQNNITIYHQDANVLNMLNMKLSTEKILININELLKLTRELKVLLLLYDYEDIYT